VVRSGAAPKASYAFTHTLIRDAAYHSLPDDVRRNLHARIAQILDADRAGGAASTPEPAARHYTAAGVVEPAVAAWLQAGERAADQGAYMEAIAGFSKGLELLDSMRATTEPVALRAQLLAALARALTVTKGIAAPEVAQACALARTLLTSADATPRLFPAVRTLWDYCNTRGELEAASELAGQCQQLAAGADDPRLRVEADFCLGVSSLFTGQLAEARQRLMRSVVPGEAPERGELAPGERQDSRSFALGHLAQVLWLSGHPDEAVRVGEEAVATARAVGHPFGLTYALLTVSWVAQFRGDAHATHALAADALMRAKAEGFPGFLAMAKILRDWAAAAHGSAKPRAAVTRVRAALDAYRSAGVEIARPYLLALLAEVHGSAAEVEHALAVLAEGAEVACATGERWYEAEIRRQEGELLLRQSITNRRLASARLCQAIALAQQQGGKALELRATLSLARLWADSGRRTQARDLLAPIYGWFKEGLATADLEASRALLDDLS
jgi:predicted ATPase